MIRIVDLIAFNYHFRNLNWRYLPYNPYIRPNFPSIQRMKSPRFGTVIQGSRPGGPETRRQGFGVVGEATGRGGWDVHILDCGVIVYI